MQTLIGFRESVNFKVYSNVINAHLATTTSGWTSASGSIAVADGSWHHVVLTYDGAWVRFYADGQLDHSWSKNGAVYSSGGVTYGCRGNGGEQLSGSTRGLEIYDVVLSAAEVYQLTNPSACPTGTYDHDSDSATECLACSAGNVVDASGACNPCSAGRYDHDSNSATECMACHSGAFATATTCVSCASGTADLDSNPATECEACGPGSFSSGEPWRVIMKSNGDDTWQYASPLWSTTELLNENDPEENVGRSPHLVVALVRTHVMWC